MSSKYLKNKSLCPLPFSGFIINPNGSVQICSISKDKLGNINTQSIEEILQSEKLKQIRRDMLDNKFPKNCSQCYEREKYNKNLNFENISNRLYHIKILKNHPFKLYESIDNFELLQLDLRWRNTCNFACVYCDPTYSSKWAVELKDYKRMTENSMLGLVEYVKKNINSLQTVYMAGGEPFMIKENLVILEEIKKHNPDVLLRINTNLSNLNNKMFDIVKELKNVHWILSGESTGDIFSYVRYPGDWNQFLENFLKIKKLPHKYSFNMTWNILSAFDIFNFIDVLQQDYQVHDNAFILNYCDSPDYLSVKNLPVHLINELKEIISNRIKNQKNNFFLTKVYKDMLNYINEPLINQSKLLYNELQRLDKVRNLNSRETFKKLYKELYNED